MRELLFRGKRTDNEGWVEGFIDYAPYESGFIIHVVEEIPPSFQDPCGDIISERYSVNPETVGQFTGLTDKNGVKIFEGDILKGEFISKPFAVEWNSEFVCYDWYVFTEDEHTGASLCNAIEDAPAKTLKHLCEIIEVIGNIHDNKNLLK